ncbi:hypothetical protein D3C72_359900 [compost metagenome]
MSEVPYTKAGEIAYSIVPVPPVAATSMLPVDWPKHNTFAVTFAVAAIGCRLLIVKGAVLVQVFWCCT